MNTSSRSSFTGKIKIYCDGADRASMLEMNANPQVQGMTTNPSLMKKAGIKDYRSFCKDILKEVREKPISFEVFADDINEMRRQALEIATWGKNVYVKIPVTNSKGESCTPLIRELSHQNIRLNVTAVFTLTQTLDVCAALKGGTPSILSIFAGRVADTGRDPKPLMAAALEICRATDSNIELLWASCREPFNIVEAELLGCPIITVPFDILRKMNLFNKDLQQMSLETVQAFKADSEAAGFNLS